MVLLRWMSPFETKIKIDIPRFQHVDFGCFGLILTRFCLILARGTYRGAVLYRDPPAGLSGRFSLITCLTTGGAHKKTFPGRAPPPRPPNWSAAVAASEGWGPTVIALVGRSRGLRRPVFGVVSKISISSQDDLGQGPACSALAMDPKQMEVRGARPLASNG